MPFEQMRGIGRLCPKGRRWNPQILLRRQPQYVEAAPVLAERLELENDVDRSDKVIITQSKYM